MTGFQIYIFTSQYEHILNRCVIYFESSNIYTKVIIAIKGQSKDIYKVNINRNYFQ